MANKQLRIEFEHVDMLKIQNVWKASDAFAENFSDLLQLKFGKKLLSREIKLLSAQDSYRGD